MPRPHRNPGDPPQLPTDWVSLAKVEPQTGVTLAKAEFGAGASPRATSEAATPQR
jgi:hypothetical protein